MASVQNRLAALDGIRGIAIILVFLTHVSTVAFRQILPESISRILFSSGITGVSLLFLLSGFFMALAYPNPTDATAFLQKRYTRVFAVFLPLVFVTMIIRIFSPVWYMQIVLLLGTTLLVHILWVYGIKRLAWSALSRALFLGFVLLQIFTALIYVVWIMRHPPVYFFETIPMYVRELFIGLANGTVSLQFGTYVPMIDGVYWSLATEVFFYIAYVLVIVPLARGIRPLRKWMTALLMLSAIPFFVGLDLFSKRFLQFSLFQPALCFYFIPGMLLGSMYRKKSPILFRMHEIARSTPIASLLFFFLAVLFKDSSLQFFPRSADPLLHILWSFPLTLAIALSLDADSVLSRFLSTRSIVFFGTISYSIYLLHTMVLHLVQNVLPIQTVSQNILTFSITAVLTVLLSAIIHYLLEKPYFMRSEKSSVPLQAAQLRQPFFGARALFLCVSAMLFACFFFAYQSNFSLFSAAVPLRNLVVHSTQIVSRDVYSMENMQPLVVEFTSPQKYLGVVTVGVFDFVNQKSDHHGQILDFRIKEKGATDWFAHNSYKIEEISNTPTLPLGFPVQTDSENRRYEIEFSMQNVESNRYVHIDLSASRAVYSVTKSDLLRDPQKLSAYLGSRLQDVFANRQARAVLFYALPLFVSVGTLLSLHPKDARSKERSSERSDDTKQK